MNTRPLKPFLFALATFAVLLQVSAAAWAQTHDEPVAGPILTSAAEITAIEEYWTDERMSAAKPMALLQEGSPHPPDEAQDPAELLGPMVAASSGLPGDEPFEMVLESGETLGESAEFGTHPFSFTRYQLYPVSMYKQHLPYRQTGKLFFTIPGQGNFVCSGASVNSANLSVVWTAAHCLATPGTATSPAFFHTNFLFAPGRANGTNHNGVWTAKQAFVLSGWFANGRFECDLGALVMNLGGFGTPDRLGSKVGFLGILTNAPRRQHWHAIGYPAAPRDLPSTPPGPQFNGEKQQICAAPWATDDQPSGGTSGCPNTLGIGCDQTGGASGGPWVVDLQKFGGATNFINGVNSYKYVAPVPPENLKIYSPYLGTGAVNLRNAAQAVPVP